MTFRCAGNPDPRTEAPAKTGASSFLRYGRATNNHQEAMSMDPRIPALIRRQSFDRNLLFRSFLEKHPTLEVDVARHEWPDAVSEDWKLFTAQFERQCTAERDALAAQLGME